MTLKQEFLEAIERLPEDATMDDILDQMYVVLKIQQGLEAGRAGKKRPASEVATRVKSWSK